MKRHPFLVVPAMIAITTTAFAAETSTPAWQMVDLQANTFTKSNQGDASVAVDSEGRTMIAWTSRRQEHGTPGIFARHLDPLGRPLGPEIHVNEFIAGAQSAPSVAFDGQDHAWITWHSFGQFEDHGSIMARRFGLDADGSLVSLTGEFRVNDPGLLHRSEPSVSTGADGHALVTWTSAAGNSSHVMARVIGPDGTPAGPATVLATGDENRVSLATSATLASKGYVVTWAQVGTNGIQGRLLDSTGQPVGNIIHVSPQDGRDHIEPSVDADATGRFVVAWMGTSDTNGYDVLSRRFDAEGRALADARTVATATDWMSGASVAVAPDGRHCVAYNVEGEKIVPEGPTVQRPAPDSDVFARLFDDHGSPLGAPFVVHRGVDGKQRTDIATPARRSDWGGTNHLVFAWNGQTPGEDRKGAALSLFVPQGLDIPAPDPIVAAVPVPETIARPVRNPEIPLDMLSIVDPVGPDYGFDGLNNTGWVPPDPEIAVGRNHVISLVNCRLGIYTKDGQLIDQQDLADFFAGQGADWFVFDPIGLYDWHSNRYIVAAAEDDNGSYLCVAVSRDAEPDDVGDWHKYRLDMRNVADFLDFPNLGVGPDAIYVAADYFGSPDGNFIHIIEKAPLLDGSPASPVEVVQTSGTQVSLGAVKTYDADAPAQYFARAHNNRQILVEAIRDPLSNNPRRDTFTFDVGSFSVPPDADQRGSSNKVSTIDTRVKNGVYRNGSLWVCHTIGQSSTARVRWYEFVMNGWPGGNQDPEMRQIGTLDFGSRQHNWFPDIHVDAEGNAALSYSRSSSDDYVYIARSVRRADDPLNTFRSSIRVQESTSAETGDRWGDYSGIDESPTEPGVFWSMNEYRINAWRTWVNRLDVNQSIVIDGGPFQAGSRATVDILSARQDRMVYVVYSLEGPGETEVPDLDVTVDLENARLAGTIRTDAGGEVTYTQAIPGTAPTGPVWVQVIEMGNTSNVLQTQIVGGVHWSIDDIER